MTPQVNTGTNKVDKEFEALWLRATNFEQDISKAGGANAATPLPALLMPQGIVNSIYELAIRCHEQGLINDTQLDEMRQCSQKQQAILGALDASKLQAVVVSFQSS